MSFDDAKALLSNKLIHRLPDRHRLEHAAPRPSIHDSSAETYTIEHVQVRGDLSSPRAHRAGLVRDGDRHRMILDDKFRSHCDAELHRLGSIGRGRPPKIHDMLVRSRCGNHWRQAGVGMTAHAATLHGAAVTACLPPAVQWRQGLSDRAGLWAQTIFHSLVHADLKEQKKKK